VYPTIFLSKPTFEAMKNPAGIKAFAAHIRRLREEKNLSQQQLADQADVAKITVQRIENAKYSVTLDVLISISKGMNIPLNKLLDFSLPKEK
jgi:transcriptional regulator with XRE-family HTH domain